MTAQSDALAENPHNAQAAASAPLSSPRPFYWSVRREVWEHASLYIAPLIAAGVVLFGFSISLMGVAHSARVLAELSDTHNSGKLALPFDFAAFAIIVTSVIVAVFYCLGALHNERRDRSILFWKSLPVSDLTAVLSKVFVPLAVAPAIAFAIIFALQFIMLMLGSVALLLHGLSPYALWASVVAPQGWLVLIYGLIVVSLWNAPIYGWLLLVSGWARRAAFLWAVLPPLALCLVEKIAFDTGNFASVIGYRLTGGFSEAFKSGGQEPWDHTPQPDPIAFLSSPGLWSGLVVAAAFLAAAVWLRRRREPI